MAARSLAVTGFFFVYSLHGYASHLKRNHGHFFTPDFLCCALEARRGLREDAEPAAAARPQQTPAQEKFQQKEKARRTGMRGETYAYWYLRRHGYIFVARNYMPHGVKGGIDLVGYDGEALAFVEVRTRTIREDVSAIPELSVNTAKRSVLIRTEQRFLANRRINDGPARFDVLAIDNVPGQPPKVRLHKDAFSPQLRR